MFRHFLFSLNWRTKSRWDKNDFIIKCFLSPLMVVEKDMFQISHNSVLYEKYSYRQFYLFCSIIKYFSFNGGGY